MRRHPPRHPPVSSSSSLQRFGEAEDQEEEDSLNAFINQLPEAVSPPRPSARSPPRSFAGLGPVKPSVIAEEPRIHIRARGNFIG